MTPDVSSVNTTPAPDEFNHFVGCWFSLGDDFIGMTTTVRLPPTSTLHDKQAAYYKIVGYRYDYVMGRHYLELGSIYTYKSLDSGDFEFRRYDWNDGTPYIFYTQPKNFIAEVERGKYVPITDEAEVAMLELIYI